MSEQEQKNAAAGQRQRQHLKEDRQKTGMMFENAGLTRKNEDFMYQLNKQLDAQGATAEAKTALLEETMTALLEGQKTGQTAKGLFGTPTKYADELLHPKKTPAEQQQTSTVLMSVDNGLMFFAIFTFMFGLIGLMQPSTLKLAQHGSAGWSQSSWSPWPVGRPSGSSTRFCCQRSMKTGNNTAGRYGSGLSWC